MIRDFIDAWKESNLPGKMLMTFATILVALTMMVIIYFICQAPFAVFIMGGVFMFFVSAISGIGYTIDKMTQVSRNRNRHLNDYYRNLGRNKRAM